MTRVLIIGATSAIAAACARRWATDGAQFMLVGRDAGKLDAVARDLSVRGASATATFVLDALDTPRHAEMLTTAVHTLGSEVAFRSKAGDDTVDAVLAEFGETVHPVVAVHPVTGRRHLNVNAEFTDHIVELSPTESRAVLDLLVAHCANPNFALRWRWTEGDLVLWDERPTLHFAVADYWPQRREVVRVNVR